jgi:DNA-binding MarR family transcriptional regulator
MEQTKDLVRAKRHGAFGTRLRRLSGELDRQVEAVYRARGVTFHPRWFPVVTALREQGAMSVGELAQGIGITHAAISQVRGELIRAGWVRVRADKADRRRQILELSAKGAREADALAPLWAAIAATVKRIVDGAAPGLIDALGRIEDELAEKSIAARLDARRKPSKEKQT